MSTDKHGAESHSDHDHNHSNGPATAELFCQCGTMRHPTGDGQLACGADCGETVIVGAGLSAALTIVERQVPRTLSVGTPASGDDAGLELGYDTTVVCQNCDQQVAATATVLQTRAADEAPTRLYECRQCGRRWREDD